MTKKNTREVKTVKAWAVTGKHDSRLWQVLHGDEPNFSFFMAICSKKREAYALMRNEMIEKQDNKVVPCTITYQIKKPR